MTTKTQKILVLFDEFGEIIKNKICFHIDDELTSKLSVSQVQLLQFLYHKEKMAMADIAKAFSIKPASATSLVDKMVKLGWVIRQADEKDRRKVYIQISVEKKPIWDKCYQDAMKQLAEMMDVLSDEQKDQFIRILEILTNK